jgi:putative restriction endonuclease
MQNIWTRDELILAFYWYCTKIPFTKIKYTKPEVIELAELVGRTPSAAAFKLVNFARLDPSLQRRGISGMSGGSKAEEIIWNEFHNNWDELSITAEGIIAARKGLSVEKVSKIVTYDLPSEGKEREAIVKIRINQNFFRKSVLLSYSNKCCITGINIRDLLIASHILPWSINLNQACNPQNGLCLNALHDKAFDRGLITLSEDLKVIVSEDLLKRKTDDFIKTYFISFHGKGIIKPSRFMPKREFLEYHRLEIFQKNQTTI